MPDRPDSAFPPISRTVEEKSEMTRIIGTVGKRKADGNWPPQARREIEVQRDGDGVVVTRQIRAGSGQHWQLCVLDEQNAIRLAAAILSTLDGDD